MIGEALDRLLTYGTPAFLIVKDLLGKMAKNPEIQKEATETLLKLTKGGRTRSDELVFISSLVTLNGVSIENKQLFLQKHAELLHPNLAGKTSQQIKKLKEKEKLAKGLIFLIATDTTAAEVDPKKRFSFAKEIWYGIFLEMDKLANDKIRLQVLEQRILHFGKNHQEKMTLAEVVEKINPFWKDKIDPLLDKVSSTVEDGVSSTTKWVNRQYEERRARAFDRDRQRREHWYHWINPKLLLEWFLDLR